MPPRPRGAREGAEPWEPWWVGSGGSRGPGVRCLPWVGWSRKAWLLLLCRLLLLLLALMLLAPAQRRQRAACRECSR